MPLREVKATFSDPFIVDGRRWMGDIKCGALQLRRGAPSLNVTRYYKAFGLLSPRS
jgi:hypothetical protein